MRLRILLAEDEELIRTILADALTMYGYEVVEVENGGRAIEELQKQEFDLVISDYQLPGVRGDKVVSLAKGMGVKTILWSGKIALERGNADKILIKPAAVHEILQAIRELFPLAA